MRAALLTLLLLLPIVAVAADTDCFSNYSSGTYHIAECFLCDGDHSATDCAEFDLGVESPDHLPTRLVVDLAATTGCSGPVAVRVRGLSQALGTPHVYGTLTAAGTSSLTIDNFWHRYLDADVDIATSADCTDLEVRLRLIYPRSP